jgi:hypothetical protein
MIAASLPTSPTARGCNDRGRGQERREVGIPDRIIKLLPDLHDQVPGTLLGQSMPAAASPRLRKVTWAISRMASTVKKP